MDDLGPIFHEADQVVFVNDHLARADLYHQVDGIYDEMANIAPSLNMSALLGVRMPVVGWVPDEDFLRPDPDGFFQRHLHLGVHPMVPFPKNDHSVRPGEWVDEQYLDYGPLFRTIRRKRWVLVADAVAVEEGDAKANVFRTNDGVVIPVTFGGDADEVTVVLGDIDDLSAGVDSCELRHPGADDWHAVDHVEETNDGRFALVVPLDRGCAVVRVRPA